MGSCNVYGPNEGLDIRDFWALLSSACLLWVALCCIGGDFNVMQFPHEKKRGRRLTRSMGRLLDFIHGNKLSTLTGAKFT